MYRPNLDEAFETLKCLREHLLNTPPENVRNEFIYERERYILIPKPLERKYQDEVLTFKIYKRIPRTEEDMNDGTRDTEKYLRIKANGKCIGTHFYKPPPFGLKEIIPKAIKEYGEN